MPFFSLSSFAGIVPFSCLSCSIYSSSVLFTNLLLEGAVYMNTQNPIHMKPRAPMITNAISHPQALASNGMLKGAIRAPIEAPALKMEVAYARSFFGKYSAVTLMAAGKLPASPSARMQRATRKQYMLIVASITTTSPVAAISSAALCIPTYSSVTTPQNACMQAPTDHTPIAQR